MKCERCEKEKPDVKKRSSMTLYQGEDWDLDENDEPYLIKDSGPVLCDDCHEEYVDYWQMMWDEYNASRG